MKQIPRFGATKNKAHNPKTTKLRHHLTIIPTMDKLTKYERARIIGTRALQISMNAPVTVDTTGLTNMCDIAEKELNENKLSLIVRRYYPDGTYVDIAVNDLQKE
tara:strand:- start:703 stop:1017 length:315 start_codon:yes stop_codon:yes gene_type:complete